MSQFAIILGRSGSGKSTSIKNLDPSTTFVINCLGKTLPFRNSLNMYNKEAGNYAKTYKYDNILKWLDHIDKTLTSITTCVIEDSTFIMREEFFVRALERAYDKIVKFFT